VSVGWAEESEAADVDAETVNESLPRSSTRDSQCCGTLRAQIGEVTDAVPAR
jgi:hypothetical protein